MPGRTRVTLFDCPNLLDEVGIGAKLEDALLTDKEMAEGKAGWKAQKHWLSNRKEVSYFAKS